MAFRGILFSFSSLVPHRVDPGGNRDDPEDQLLHEMTPVQQLTQEREREFHKNFLVDDIQ